MNAVVEAMEPIPLVEVLADAALDTRVDRKYVVDHATWERVAARLAGTFRALEIDDRRAFRYESVYFDTPALVSYHAAAYRRRRRFKVRTRTYLDSSECVLEIKRRGGRDETVKTRFAHPVSARTRLTQDAVAVIGEALDDAAAAVALRPVLVSRYRRTTLVDTAAGVRVTCDVDLEVGDVDGPALASLPDRLVVETKGGAAPCTADRLLWSAGVRPVRLSKYATGLAALRPELPSNAWHRTIHRDLGWAPVG